MRSVIWCLTGRSARGRLCDSCETCMKGGQQPRVLRGLAASFWMAVAYFLLIQNDMAPSLGLNKGSNDPHRNYLPSHNIYSENPSLILQPQLSDSTDQ